MQKCDAEMINFRGNATNVLSEIVTIVTQQRKLLDEFKAKIEAMRDQKEMLSKQNVPEIKNIARPTSSYTQSLKLNKPKTIIRDQKSQLSFHGIIDNDDDLIIPTQ
uniref:Uncharacterized protein n=1 Tax=Romanomermis culicivorax TaxID=13658 RepID=A0A915J7F8_ROMCU